MGYNQDYQRELALSLVEGCGVEGAIDFAQLNSWDGVLAQIIAVGGRTADSNDQDEEPQRR